MSPILQISLFAALAFLVIGSPSVYKLTSSVLPFVTDDNGTPTFLGSALHAVVAGVFVALYLRMFAFNV